MKKGAAVAIDPRTGAIQAMVSMPSFDPNPLASHDEKTFQAAYKKLNEDKDKPLLNRAIAETLPPGSTMKVIISAAALQNGYTQQTEIEAGSQLHPAGQRRADPQRRGRGLPGRARSTSRRR